MYRDLEKKREENCGTCNIILEALRSLTIG